MTIYGHICTLTAPMGVVWAEAQNSFSSFSRQQRLPNYAVAAEG